MSVNGAQAPNDSLTQKPFEIVFQARDNVRGMLGIPPNVDRLPRTVDDSAPMLQYVRLRSPLERTLETGVTGMQPVSLERMPEQFILPF